MSKVNTAVFVSGRGSNLEALLKNEASFHYKVSLVLVSKADALAIDTAKANNIPYVVLNKSDFKQNKGISELLKRQEIKVLCLAGFLWKIPSYLIQLFPETIINIHPSLLPKYGGKGMYGMNVHNAVIAAKEKESGITIHLVNEKYDDGKILFQAKVSISNQDDAKSLALKVLSLEHANYPKILDQLCTN